MTTMRVLYDHQIFSLQHHGGISRYYSQLLQFFTSDQEVKFSLPVKYSNTVYLREMGLKPDILPLEQNAHRIINSQETINQILEAQFDIFHPTYFDTYFLEYIGSKPFILTIYDMIHEIFVEHFPLTDPNREQKKLLAQKAAKIIAISNNTKKDVLAHYNIDEQKISVIHLATAMQNTEQHGITIPKDFPKEYILFVGDRWHYKNFYFFLEAMSPLLLENSKLFLVCGGGFDFTKDEIQYAQKLGVASKIFHYAIDDRVLALLYSHAKVFVFPSLYEGFGIPVLEAFACGCPVAVSNTSSFPEVVENAGEYFDPKDISSLQNAVVKVLYDVQHRKKLIINGYRRFLNFSWEKTAFATKQVYKSLMNINA
ncbi:MAG: glycosyltransferase family 4 protein [Chitinivibrionales bacterium]|nr:glycosyltransferase family 4 protein [Chitinivibrionales bacterium]